MTAPKPKKDDFSDEELEEIMDIKAPKELVRELEATIKESPLLVMGLVFAFGLLVGVSLGSGRRRSR